jgi:hypothetical protein
MRCGIVRIEIKGGLGVSSDILLVAAFARIFVGVLF